MISENIIEIMPKRFTTPRQKRSRLRVKTFAKKWKKKTKFSRSLIFWKLLKIILFSICLTLFLYQSTNFLLVYYKYQTTTKIEFTYPDKFEFPAVTFCNKNILKRSKFCAEYPDLCERPSNITQLCEIQPSLCEDNTSNLVIPKLGFHTNDSDEKVVDAILGVYYSGNTTREFWEEWAWNIRTGSETLDKELKPVFIMSPGLYNPCFSFNLRLNSTDEPGKIDLNSRYIKRTILSYMLDLPSSEEMLVFMEPFAYVAIHSPFVPTNPFDQGSFLKVGYKYNMYIRLEEENELPSPYATNCTIYEDLWSTSNPHKPRSKQMCEEVCLHNLFETLTNITVEFKSEEMVEVPFELCVGCEISSEEKDLLEKCRRNCRPSCRNLKYTTTITETELKPMDFRHPTVMNYRDVIQVDIVLVDRQVVVERHVPLYDIGHLFSYIGGLMGCWLGVSIWAFAGIAEKVFRRVVHWIHQIKSYYKESSTTQHTYFSTHHHSAKYQNSVTVA